MLLQRARLKPPPRKRPAEGGRGPTGLSSLLSLNFLLPARGDWGKAAGEEVWSSARGRVKF